MKTTIKFPNNPMKQTTDNFVSIILFRIKSKTSTVTSLNASGNDVISFDVVILFCNILYLALKLDKNRLNLNTS